MIQKFDSLIFDMDGTLWDAVDSYCTIWNVTFEQMGLSQTVSRQELLECMGKPINEIFKKIVIEDIDENKYLALLDRNESELMPKLGGVLYNGVAEGIKLLSSRYKLFMVSNCGADGLKNFLKFTKLEPYFIDTLAYGENNLPKAENIKLIISRNNLSNPAYVGDTQGDCNAAHAAGVPMIFAQYGFGKCEDAEYKIDSFPQLFDVLYNQN